MKLLTSSVLAAAVLLSGPAAAQVGVGRPPNPMDKAKATLIDEFTWRDPFTDKTEALFTPSCEATRTFAAEQFTLHQLYDKQPRGLWSYAGVLKKFWSTSEYPGSWSGLDRHGWDRNVLSMSYDEVPLRVREWIEAQDRDQTVHKGLFGIFPKPKDKHEKVKERIEMAKDGPLDRDEDGSRLILFAPGALYTVLPLFVADNSDCKDIFSDLSKYSPNAIDGGVVAWPIEHTRPKLSGTSKAIEFTIKAQVLQAKPEEAVDKEAVASAEAEEEREEEAIKDEL